jgi:beta-N-acetylhexosaminidase
MKKYVFAVSMFLCCLLGVSVRPSAAHPSARPAAAAVADLFAQLTPEQRIGQLFLVTFNGTNVAASSEIAQLIKNYAVGGVLLTNQRDNFTAGATSADDIRALITNLQTFAATTASAKDQPFLPMLVGVAQGGNGFVTNPIRNGVTPLPSALALGATWQPDYAQTIGQIAGSELSSLGFNLLFAPNLDVLAYPKPYSPSDPQANVFGGNPFWVSRFAKAYVAGLHSGSNNRLAVVAPNFPGLGAGDRSAVSDIPTVTDSLEILRSKDLQPFFGVMSLTAASGETLDGVQVPHARYIALQGAGTTDIPPLSVDSRALPQLLDLPEISSWRAAGGVTISSSLGQARVRLYYDPSGTSFPAFTIARDALLSGNDMLLLDEFGLRSQDQAKTITNTLQQFLRKYQEDPTFADRVDSAVMRILTFKQRLFPELTLETTLPKNISVLPERHARQLLTIASDAATLLSPSKVELAQRLPRPPNANERLVFLVDEAPFQQCSQCPIQSELQVKDFEQVVLRLYGADATAQVQSVNLASYSFTELGDFLKGNASVVTDPSGRPPIQDGLQRADWIVVLLRTVNNVQATENPLRRFLQERPDLLEGRKVVVFALNAPYYLDATEVSQLTAYFGLYSHTAPFIEVAARLLFKELTPKGASPVSVDAIGYELANRLQPDPTQAFSLALDADLPDEVGPTLAANETAGPDATAAPLQTSNRTKQLITSPLYDRNGHLVPDGTLVEFVVTYLSEGQLTKIFARNGTVSGVARATLAIERAGLIEIQAQAGDAFSQKLQFNVTSSSVQVMQTPLAAVPTVTAMPSATATLPPVTLLPPVTPTPIVAPVQSDRVGIVDLLSACLAALVLGAAGWRLSHSRGQAVSSGVKITLLTAIGVLVSYNYYTLGGPGVAALSSITSIAPTIFAWVGGCLGFGLGWLLFKRLAI